MAHFCEWNQTAMDFHLVEWTPKYGTELEFQFKFQMNISACERDTHNIYCVTYVALAQSIT